MLPAGGAPGGRTCTWPFSLLSSASPKWVCGRGGSSSIVERTSGLTTSPALPCSRRLVPPRRATLGTPGGSRGALRSSLLAAPLWWCAPALAR
eukprot:14236826-Alexandrium_andersonii.AAC.1